MVNCASSTYQQQFTAINQITAPRLITGNIIRIFSSLWRVYLFLQQWSSSNLLHPSVEDNLTTDVSGCCPTTVRTHVSIFKFFDNDFWTIMSATPAPSTFLAFQFLVELSSSTHPIKLVVSGIWKWSRWWGLQFAVVASHEKRMTWAKVSVRSNTIFIFSFYPYQ